MSQHTPQNKSSSAAGQPFFATTPIGGTSSWPVSEQVKSRLAGPPKFEVFAAMTNQEILARYRVGVENFDKRVLKLSDQQLDTAFLPDAGVGRWPVRVLLGHLADAEIVFTHRIRRTVAEDNPVLAVWDENAFLDAGLYEKSAGGNPAAFIATIFTMRKWTGEWLATLTDAQWQRKCLHPQRGEQTTRIILNYTTWHIEHHNWFLAGKIEKLFGGML